MTKIINYQIPVIIGNEDIFIENDVDLTKVNVYQDEDGDFNFRVMNPDGLHRFCLKRETARELVEKLLEKLEN